MSSQTALTGLQALETLKTMIASLPSDIEQIRKEREAILTVSASFVPETSSLAAAIVACRNTLRSRAAETSAKQRATALKAKPPEVAEAVFHEKQTIVLPKFTEVSLPAHWEQIERLLYEDVLHLFELGDQNGALTSLERLIMLNPQAEELKAFLEKNGALLEKLYTDHMGTLDRVPVPLDTGHQIKIPTSFAPLLMDILRLIDGHRTIRDILKKSKFGTIPTLATIAHLGRSGFIELT